MRDKIDRTIMRSLDMVEKLEKLFGNNGAFEQAVAENGGDIGWFGDVRENLKTLYSNIEELHMGAVSHMDESESVAESKMADMMIAASEMSKEEFAKAYPAFAKDYEKLRKQQMADEANPDSAEIIDEGGMKQAAIEVEEWAEKYNRYSGVNGDELANGWLEAKLNSGILSDAFDEDEYDAFNEQNGYQDDADWEPDDIEKFMSSSPITGGMFREIDQIMKTYNLDEQDVSDLVRGFDESSTNASLSYIKKLAGL